jgi:serine/threonine-protein kinase HipA
MTDPSSSLESLRQVAHAIVFKAGRPAATLSRVEDATEFRYFPEWIAAGGPPVATTLPVSGDPVTRPHGALPPFFTNLLPEGRRLTALRNAVKTSADDELSLLLGVGSDLVGDVAVAPDGVEPSEVPPRITLPLPEGTSFSALLHELGIRVHRAGLPGVQDKVSAGMINLPVARAGERFLLKLNPPEFPYLVENEDFFLRAARRSGLSVPAHEVIRDEAGSTGLLVQRFDRVTVDGTVAPLAVEDGCQTCNVAPASKYRLGTERVFSSLVAVCDAPAVAARDLLRQLAFAFLTGNGDAHAKNFSVVQERDGEWRVSPAYDVPSSQPYGDNSMALPLGGKLGANFTFRDFAALAAHLQLNERATRRTISELCERVDLWIDDLDMLPLDSGRVRKLRRVIDNRRSRLFPKPAAH